MTEEKKAEGTTAQEAEGDKGKESESEKAPKVQVEGQLGIVFKGEMDPEEVDELTSRFRTLVANFDVPDKEVHVHLKVT